MRSEASLIESARGGDEAAFGEIAATYRRELEAHCYRMLGSLADAEDAMQETLVRAWKGLAGFAGRSSLRTWLYRIATNVSIDLAARRPARSMPDRRGPPLEPGAMPAGPIDDPIWLDPAPPDLWSAPDSPEARVSARQSVAVAFMTLLHELPATQRAVLLLREVIGFSAAETAELLDSSVAAVNSTLQRARATLDRGRERPVAAPDDAAVQELLRRYIEAWESGTPDLLARLLLDDAVLTMPPDPSWFSGAEAILGFFQWLQASGFESRYLPASAAGGVAAAGYLRAPGESVFRPVGGIHVIEWAGDRVAGIHAFRIPDRFPRFGLPAELTA